MVHLNLWQLEQFKVVQKVNNSIEIKDINLLNTCQVFVRN